MLCALTSTPSLPAPVFAAVSLLASPALNSKTYPNATVTSKIKI